MRDLTKKEIMVLNALGQAWNLFLDLPIVHNDDYDEFRHTIHAAQALIQARPAIDTTIAIESEI